MAGVRAEDRLDRVQTVALLGRALRFARPHWRPGAVALACVVVVTGGTLAGPILVRHGIDAGVIAGDSGALNTAVVAYLAVLAISFLVARRQHLALNTAGEGFLKDLRVAVFDRLQHQSLAYYDRHPAGVLIARMTADIESMGELVQWGLLQFLAAGLLLVLALGVLVVLSWELTLITLVVFPVIVIASVRFQRSANRAYLDVREQVGSTLAQVQEGIATVRVVQASGAEDRQRARFAARNASLLRSHLHSVRISTGYFGLIEFAGVVATALLVGLGGWLVHRDTVSLGTVVAFVLLVANLFDPVQQLSQLYNSLQSAAASLHKLFGILDHVPEVDQRPDARDLAPRGDLVLSGVSFRYPGTHRDVLSDVDLSIRAGERIAFVGPTGAGKSTLAKLVARLYDPTEGSITWGGVDLRDATLTSLRRNCVVVPQEGFLFSGTVADNIRLGRPEADEVEVAEALERIGVADRFAAFPDGLATEVHERGSRLSAGERQLVSLARVALVDPALLVLDEATSNLDPGTEAIVERALTRLMAHRTVIVVAHRLSTVRSADRIVVVDEGWIREIGTHDDLVASGGRYAALARAWERAGTVS